MEVGKHPKNSLENVYEKVIKTKLNYFKHKYFNIGMTKKSTCKNYESLLK